MGVAEFVVFADVLAYVEEFADFDFGADFFKAFAFQALSEGLAVVLAASG